MILVAIISALCGLASLLIAEITAWALFLTIAKICGVVCVIAVLIAIIKFIFELCN